jgi:hypothetical protein
MSFGKLPKGKNSEITEVTNDDIGMIGIAD